MKKLAVIFPGVGYTCTKPLLYYTASMAAERGYEIIRLDYGQDIHTFHGRTPAELEPIIKLAIKRTLPNWKTFLSLNMMILFLSPKASAPPSPASWKQHCS